MKHIILIILSIVLTFLPSFSQQNINEINPAKMDGKVTIINIAGRVSITGWEKEEVSITGTIGKNVEKLEFFSKDNKTVIKAIIPKKFLKKSKNIKCILDIKVPEQSDLNINFISSDINILNVYGDAKIKTVSGDIINNGDLQAVDIESVSGDIKIEGNLKELNIETISGDVEISGILEYIETGIISGDVDLEGSFSDINIKSVSGNIKLKNDTLNNGEFNTTSGDIFLDCNPLNNAKLEAQTTSGDIKLILKEKLNAQFILETFSGDINIKDIFDENQNNSINNIELEGKNKKIKFTQGSKDTRISLQTFSGDIIIKNENN